MGDYDQLEVWVHVQQLLPPEVPLRDISEKHEEDLRAEMQGEEYDYGTGFMKVTTGREIADPNEFKRLFVRHSEEGKLSLAESAHVELIDGGHRRMIMLRGIERGDPLLAWAAKPIRVILLTRHDNKRLRICEKLKLAYRANVKAGVVLESNSMMDILSRMSRYALGYMEKFGVSFLDATITSISEDLKLSLFLNKLQIGSYKRYVRVCKLVVAMPSVLETLKAMEAEGGSSVVGITHLDDKTFLGAGKVFLPYLLYAVDMYLRQRDRLTFNPHGFYTMALQLLSSLYDLYKRLPQGTIQSFRAFMDVEIPLSGTSTQTIWVAASNVMKRFRYDAKDRRGKYVRESEERSGRLVKRVRNKFFPPANKAPQQVAGSIGAGVRGATAKKRSAREFVADIVDAQPEPGTPPKRSRKKPARYGEDDAQTPKTPGTPATGGGGEGVAPPHPPLELDLTVEDAPPLPPSRALAPSPSFPGTSSAPDPPTAAHPTSPAPPPATPPTTTPPHAATHPAAPSPPVPTSPTAPAPPTPAQPTTSAPGTPAPQTTAAPAVQATHSSATVSEAVGQAGASRPTTRTSARQAPQVQAPQMEDSSATTKKGQAKKKDKKKKAKKKAVRKKIVESSTDEEDEDPDDPGYLDDNVPDDPPVGYELPTDEYKGTPPASLVRFFRRPHTGRDCGALRTWFGNLPWGSAAEFVRGRRTSCKRVLLHG